MKSNKKRTLFTLLISIICTAAMAETTLKGTVIDRGNNEPLGFVTIQIAKQGQDQVLGGAITDIDGNFKIEKLQAGQYTLTLTYLGYKQTTKDVEVAADKKERSVGSIYMEEDSRTLKELVVTGQRSAMKLEVDRKSFDISQMISSEGQAASDILENIPSVEVDNDGNVSLRGNSSVEVWINGKASGLTTDNRASILQQIPAESIETIEVIDNPSSKYSAEGSAGIINIVLKKNRTAGYYGSVQVGGNTNGGAQASVNINYSSKVIDVFGSVGYHHRASKGHTESQQINYTDGDTIGYTNYNSDEHRKSNNIFCRAGLTYHITDNDDVSFTGMFMDGGSKNNYTTPYHYGTYDEEGIASEYVKTRYTTSKDDMMMMNGEFNYTHSFSDKHKIDFDFSANKWKSDGDNFYRDITDYTGYNDTLPLAYSWQYYPRCINNRSLELRLDYENQINEFLKIEAGYNWNHSHENTPQQSYESSTTDGTMPDVFESTSNSEDYSAYEDELYFNRFIYDLDVHAGYVSANAKLGKFGIMAGLRGEYWTVETESYDWQQEYAGKEKDEPFNKDYFELFPSIFGSYEITPNDQLQLNYTRRLQRPWGGQLNSFRDTRDATQISFGNPELTPEFSNSFSLNYLRTWTEHSLLLSLYYNPTNDVIQEIRYRDTDENIMYSTRMNVAKSQSSGLEITGKNKLWRILDLNSNVNIYYYKLDAFNFEIDGQTVSGESEERLSWNARMQASVILPYDISVQLSGRYRSRQAITQGYRPSTYMMDFGARKNFFNKKLTLSINCRDLLDSRKWQSVTSSDTYWRKQINRRNSRNFSATLTWNFGNLSKKPMQSDQHDSSDSDDSGSSSGYDMN